jgi:hypothetical protein
MTALTQGAPPCRFILSEANGGRSRQNGTLVSGQNLAAGTVVMDNGAGKLTAYLGGDESGGAQTPAGILLYKSDASAGDLAVSYLARSAEVNLLLLTYTGTAAQTTEGLGFLGIVTRDADGF